MKHFLAILLKEHFTLYYKFGYAFIPKSELLEFNEEISDDIKESIVKQFASTTPFEYEQEYLILHFEKMISENEIIVRFEIRDIVAIYPLSQQTKSILEAKLDPRIRLENPVFESVLPKIEAQIEKNEIKNAISALWSMCKCEGSWEDYISKIGIENIFNGLGHRKNGTKAFKILGGNYWEYVISYDRYDYFPNSILGYFYDAGQVFAYSKGLSTFENTTLYKLFEHINNSNPEIKTREIIDFLEFEQPLKPYVSSTNINGIKQYVITPLFFLLRDDIRKSEDISQTILFRNIDQLKKFDESFNYVIVLLGAFFGFRKLYDAYYDFLNLRFFKEKNTDETKIKPINRRMGKSHNLESSINFNKNHKEELSKNSAETSKYDNSNNIKVDIDSKTEIQHKPQTFTTNKVQVIILDLFKKKHEISFTTIKNEIKHQTGQKFTNNEIIKIIESMENFELLPKSKPTKAKRKESTIEMFKE